MKVYGVLRAVLLLSSALKIHNVLADTNLCEVHVPESISPTPPSKTAYVQSPVFTVGPISPGNAPSTPTRPGTATSTPKGVSAPAPKGSVPKGVSTVVPKKVSDPAPKGPSAPAPGPGLSPTLVPAPTTVPTVTPGAPGSQQSTPGEIKSSFSYKGGDGGRPGSYNMVTDFATCSKKLRQTTGTVSPLDDDVSISFRGPMTIYNIAVFDGRSGNWKKVSSFTKGASTENMVFMSNNNIDFNGKSSPQGYATSDGRGVSKQPQIFSGELGAATNPSTGFLSSEKTGAEVNILTSEKCGQGTECKGYYDKDGTAHKGWEGGKKIFITKVQMPHGSAPNLPAVWMLNGQVVRANQYGCNCRGMSKEGGCGELDIAEVLEKNANVVATHYYFYNGVPSPGHDSWSKRPVNNPTIYVTIIDESYGVKVVELGADGFNFQSNSIANDVVSKWLQA